ncbi:DUF4376 domain-containing protein [Agrobacterium rhizogenes]|nr:DUF4376 domain-containing protein [Rhizobium rhizogenes]
MAKYLRVLDGVAVEEWSEPDGVSIDQCFTPETAATFHLMGSAEIGWTWDGAEFAAPVTAPVTVSDLISYAAAKRYSLETGGFIYSSHPIATDNESQGKIGNVALAANIVGTSFSTAFKCSDGSFFTLSQTDAIAMATAVMTFVSACYGTEADVCAKISSGKIKTTAQVDAAAWPANS